ncbi:hypothetical protein BU24DRAFT_452219 [Aaosphaeria arxii CBS 175.79]|uniref:SPT2-domain-containing protein n=1 Tax=Aaosphaeria arxii CBS 175.79 TaxID=1450172 RepID=A0A6A5XK01_9PLEO|nr:uncharacterized protein BU24DRAFT_452219 [Aaosphaeria arxii CBS 175.79]KAF2013283.1 hypothetical protein BU24DRAFT_452219 [Aaosphaeria arxii CBS 175.79]
MSLLNNLLSSIDPAAAGQISTSTTRQTPAAPSPKPNPRPAARPAQNGSIGGAQAGALKRKADGQPDGGQIKVQRKEGPAQPVRPNPATRPVSYSDAAKAKPTPPTGAVPYRGTAGIGASNAPKPANVVPKRPAPVNTTQTVTTKPLSQAPKTPTSSTASTPTATAGGAQRPVAKKGYAAMLAQAKQKEQTKPPTAPVRHEPTKILTKKEREALRAAAKGKQPGPANQKAGPKGADAKQTDVKNKPQEKGKSVGYQGTARPMKKPIEVGYKGTAKPASATPGPSGKAGAMPTTKAKQTQQSKRYDGYANWSDLDDMEDDEEDYDSGEDLSDMEGGIWDVEDEEQLALKAARKEDAEALAEENEHRRQKEERKRKLAAMAKAAAGRRKF